MFFCHPVYILKLNFPTERVSLKINSERVASIAATYLLLGQYLLVSRLRWLYDPKIISASEMFQML